MNRLSVFAAIIFFAASVSAQKGVDTQTQKIRQESTKTTQSSSDTSATSSTGRVIDFGKDKTPTRQLLANPYKLSSRRDVLVSTVINLLKEQKLVLDESSSKLNEGIIITQPYVFARGNVISQNELNRYATIPADQIGWRSGRYSLRIDIESIDGIQNNVSVTAKVDGKTENGLMSEWTTLQSSGVAEDEFLTRLVENVTGTPINPPKPETAERP